MGSIQGGVPLSRVNTSSDDDDDDDDDIPLPVRDDKARKVGPTFSSFNPCPTLSFVATDNTKRFQSLNIVLKNKSGPLGLEFNGCEDKF